jgi:hypothetical protein
LPTLDDALAVVGAPAVVDAVAADVDVAELVATRDLLATVAAAVEMLLICMIARLHSLRRNLQIEVSAGSSKPLVAVPR